MKLCIELPEVYTETEEEMRLLIKLKNGTVDGVTYVSMDDRCYEQLEYNDGAKIDKNIAETSELNCTDCVLDGTDACSRGAGRAVDSKACEDFLSGKEQE